MLLLCACSVNKGPEMEIDNLLCKISALANLLSSLEKKVCERLEVKKVIVHLGT